jgi:hypothetical protein
LLKVVLSTLTYFKFISRSPIIVKTYTF